MRCNHCVLLSSDSAGLAIGEFVSRLSRCDECPVISGAESSTSAVVTLLVGKLRESAGDARRLANKVRRAEHALRELSAEIAQSDLRVSKLEAIHSQSSREVETELRAQIALVEQQQAEIRALATPIIEVGDGVLVLPLIGDIDESRVAELMGRLLARISDRNARFAILELTGVSAMDETTVQHLLTVVRAVSLLGSGVILCGLRPQLAQMLSAVQMDLSNIRAARSLKEALLWCRRTP